MSSNSWGGAPTAWGGFSPVSSWGTMQTHPTFPKPSNTPTTIPLSFGSPAQTVDSAWELGPRRGTSSHTVHSPYIVSGTKASSASTSCTAPVGPSPPPSILINPSLLPNSPHRLVIDFSVPPWELPSYQSMGVFAFSPCMTSARIIINGPKRWFLELPHSHNPITVASLLSQIYNFLQQIEPPNDPLSSRIGSTLPNTGSYRDQNLHRDGYVTGLRRIDMLGSQCYLKGFEPAGGNNTWSLHFRLK